MERKRYSAKRNDKNCVKDKENKTKKDVYIYDTETRVFKGRVYYNICKYYHKLICFLINVIKRFEEIQLS